MGLYCDTCKIIPEAEIPDKANYFIAMKTLTAMVNAGDMELVYASCPLENIFDEKQQFRAQKYFHQLRCKDCGMIFGVFYNTKAGGQIKINSKIFNPDDYAFLDKGKEEKEGEQ